MAEDRRSESPGASGDPAVAWPAVLAAGLTLVSVGAFLLWIWRTCGELVFPLDDGYIHLAVARTLATTGTWGLYPGAFASPSSSPLWTLLLAASFLIFRPALWISLFWSTLFAVLSGASLARLGQRAGLSSGLAVVAALVVVILIPLPSMAAIGMEHTLQIWVALALLEGAFASRPRPKHPWGLLVLCVLAPMVRYELLFLVLPICGLVALEGRWRRGLELGAASASSVLAYAAFSLSQGGLPLPTSLMLKASPQDLGQRLEWIKNNLLNAGLGLPLVLGLLALVFARRSRLRAAGAVVAVAAALQAVLGRTGWGWRYEAWLVALAAPVGFGLLVLAGRWRRGLGAALGLVLAALLAPRAWGSLSKSADAARDVMDLWVAPARLLARLPPAPTAINALGAMAWEAGDRPLLDLDGLGSPEIAALLRARALDAGSLAEVLERKGIKLMFLSTGWQVADGWAPQPPWQLVLSVYTHTHYQPGVSISGLYARDDETARSLAAVFANGALPDEVVTVAAEGVHLRPAALEGPAVQVEASRVALYSNGEVRWVAPGAGRLTLTVSAELPDGRPVPAWVRLGDREAEQRAVGMGAARWTFDSVAEGEALTVAFRDDRLDADGRDWNLFVWDVAFEPATQAPPGQAPSGTP